MVIITLILLILFLGWNGITIKIGKLEYKTHITLSLLPLKRLFVKNNLAKNEIIIGEQLVDLDNIYFTIGEVIYTRRDRVEELMRKFALRLVEYGKLKIVEGNEDFKNAQETQDKENIL